MRPYRLDLRHRRKRPNAAEISAISSSRRLINLLYHIVSRHQSSWCHRRALLISSKISIHLFVTAPYAREAAAYARQRDSLIIPAVLLLAAALEALILNAYAHKKRKLTCAADKYSKAFSTGGMIYAAVFSIHQAGALLRVKQTRRSHIAEITSLVSCRLWAAASTAVFFVPDGATHAVQRRPAKGVTAMAWPAAICQIIFLAPNMLFIGRHRESG